MIGMKSSGVSGRLQAILFAVLDKNRFLAGFMVIDGYDFHKALTDNAYQLQDSSRTSDRSSTLATPALEPSGH